MAGRPPAAMKAVVIGGGGHARSVIDALRASGVAEPVACTDPRAELEGTTLDGVPIVGADDQLGELKAGGARAAYIGIGGNADNSLRRAAFERARELGFALPALVHPAAVVAATASLGAGSVVLATAVVGP